MRRSVVRSDLVNCFDLRVIVIESRMYRSGSRREELKAALMNQLRALHCILLLSGIY